jgi:hypothetical protein
VTTPNQSAPDGAFTVGTRYGQDITEDSAKATMTGGVVTSYANAQDVAHTTYNDPINDHSRSITTLQEQVSTLLLGGQAWAFTANTIYYPTAGTTQIKPYLLAAGAGGAAGAWNVSATAQIGGGAGSGGGETHAVIPAAFLPVDGSGNFTGIAIVVGAAGTGGTSSGQNGGGGGDTTIGPLSGSPWMRAGGGNGGVGGPSVVNSTPAAGGTGTTPGGTGGTGYWYSAGDHPAGTGGNSTNPAEPTGGGGGGGGGGGNSAPGAPGGSVSGFAQGGTEGNPGSSPWSAIPSGAGGGGGGFNDTPGGGGGYPSGGGSGGGAGLTTFSAGQNGGNGKVYVLETLGTAA